MYQLNQVSEDPPGSMSLPAYNGRLLDHSEVISWMRRSTIACCSRQAREVDATAVKQPFKGRLEDDTLP